MPIINNEQCKRNTVKDLDIRGRLCPMTFIYTKLALEEMNKGDILEVLLDFPPALKNIPDSCKRQNLAKLLKIKELDSNKHIWQLTLERI